MNIDSDRLLRLLLQHRAMLLGYIVSIVRNHHLAEDIFQDMSLIMIRKDHAIDSEQRFPAWVRTVARLECMNALRKQKRSPVAIDDAVLDALDAQWNESDSGQEPEAMDALRSCLQKLTPRARNLVEQRYQKNISGKRLAEQLARPVNTVYVAMSRIHRSLAECIRMKLGMSAQ